MKKIKAFVLVACLGMLLFGTTALAANQDYSFLFINSTSQVKEQQVIKNDSETKMYVRVKENNQSGDLVNYRGRHGDYTNATYLLQTYGTNKLYSKSYISGHAWAHNYYRLASNAPSASLGNMIMVRGTWCP